MPRRDTFHDLVRRLLERDGWIITHDPLVLTFGTYNLFVDIGAQAPIAAEKDGRKLAVEVKSFITTEKMKEFERCLGQFTLYRFLIRRREPDRRMVLAVTAPAYAAFFDMAEGRDLTAELDLSLLVFDPEKDAIVIWPQ